MKTSFKFFLIILAGAFALAADVLFPGSGVMVLAGTAIAVTRFSNAKEINAYESKGIKAAAATYAATLAWVAQSAFRQYVSVTQLTGAMTINATLTNLNQWDEVIFIFEADASPRIVTFGTGFLSSGTVTVTAAKGATVYCVYDGTALRVIAREIYA